MLYIASDHAGFRLKEEIKNYLDQLQIDYQDLGPKKIDPDDDYPDFAFKVANKVAKSPDEHRGILICGTGQGMMRAANQVKGVRAILAWNEFTAEMAKAQGNANILTLGGQATPLNAAKKIISKWLSTSFSGEKRHKRRLEKIDKGC